MRIRRSKWKSLPKTNGRRKVIVPSELNKELLIVNGNKERLVKITTKHIGYRIGALFDSKKTAIYKK